MENLKIDPQQLETIHNEIVEIQRKLNPVYGY